MSDDELAFDMSVPLDSDGFLRRECPTCEREFKWLPSSGDDDEEAAPAPGGGYFCPYCGIQAPTESWFTKAQLELVENMVSRQVVGPMLQDFSRDLGRHSGGMISVSGSYDSPDEMEPLTEADDMRHVAFECHPAEPVKVLDDWKKPVSCLICGQPAA